MGYDFKTVAGERPEVNPEVYRLSPIEDMGLRLRAIASRRVIPTLESLSPDMETLLVLYQEGAISKQDYQILFEEFISLADR